MLILLSLSLLADASPEETIATGDVAYARLSDGERLFADKMKLLEPLPGFDKDEIREHQYGLVEIKKVWPISKTESHFFLGNQHFILRSAHAARTADNPEYRWPRIAVYITREQGENVIQEINLDSDDIRAVLAGQAMERRKCKLSAVGECFFRDLYNGKWRAWRSNGVEVTIEAKEMSADDIRWIKNYRAKENLFRECRLIEQMADSYSARLSFASKLRELAKESERDERKKTK